MTVAASLYTALTGNATVSGLVSTRIYPVVAPQNATLPHVIYNQIARDPLVGIGGANPKSRFTFQFDCLATTYAGAHALADAVGDALEAATTFTAVPYGKNDYFDNSLDRYRVSVEYSVTHAD